MRGRGNGTMRASAIQQMQRSAGNRAVQRLLAGRAAAVTPPISGRPNAVSVQRNGTGLAGAGAIGEFTANIKAPLAAWDSHGADLEKRQRALFEPATRQLEALGAPRITSMLKHEHYGGDSTFAAFMPATWMVLINPRGLQANATDEEKARVAGAIYHEIRHAEQYFRIARMLAGEGAEQELSALGLRADVVAQARKNPLPRPQSAPKKGLLESDKEFGPREQGFKEQQREYQEAKAWHEATIRYHFMTVKKDETEKEYYAAKATQATDPERYKAAWLQYRQAYKLYQSTAVEADAWAVGGKVESQLGFKPNTLETELAKMPADPRTFKPITTGDTPSTPLRSRAIGTGAPPSYKPQLGSTGSPPSMLGSDVGGSTLDDANSGGGVNTTSPSPFTPPVRTPRKLGAFSPLTPLDPSTISATDEVPFTPPVRQGRKLWGFSPLTPLDPSTFGAIETQVPDLDDAASGGAIPTATPQIPTPSNGPRRPRLGVFSPRPAIDPSTSNMPGPETSDLAAPTFASSANSGGAISTSPSPFTPPVRQGRKLGGFSPLTPLDPGTISATDTETPTPDATGGPRRDDDETNLQLTVQRHAVPDALAQALSRQQIPEEELTKKG
jgi:hypothetical protein